MCQENLDKEYLKYVLSFFSCDFEEFFESEIMTKDEFMQNHKKANGVEKNVK